MGSLYSINNLAGYLKSLGHKISKAVISDYLNWFEDAYIFFTVRLFDPSHARAQANPKKIYCVDHALIQSISSGILVNSGHLLENLVFITLRRFSLKIYYYKSKNGQEIDFIIKNQDNSKILIQACDTLAEPKTRKRELHALKAAMTELHTDSGMIVTRIEEEYLTLESGHIHVIPIWKFLLLTW
jgi:uncharacterized protein